MATDSKCTLFPWTTGFDATVNGGLASSTALAMLRHEATQRSSTTDSTNGPWFDGLSKMITQQMSPTVWPIQTEVLLKFASWYLYQGEWPKAIPLADAAVNLARRADIPAM